MPSPATTDELEVALRAIAALAWLLLLGAAASGCDSSSGTSAGTESTTTTAGEAAACVKTPVTGPSGTSVVAMPPAPVITRAWHDDERFYVELDLPETPEACRPLRLVVTASSSTDGSNQALPLEDTGEVARGVEYRPGPLRVVLRRPILDLPPYIAFAGSYSERGSSATARFPIPEEGDYCLRHRPADRCQREAQALAKRCVRGEAPRARCADWAYAAQRPSPRIPVQDASVAAVEKNLREVLTRQLANDVRLAELTCGADYACVATFRRRPQEGPMRVRYALSGHEGEPGCWFAATIDVLEPHELDAPSPLAPGVPLNNQASCLSWKR
jgi:hypothetical protein